MILMITRMGSYGSGLWLFSLHLLTFGMCWDAFAFSTEYIFAICQVLYKIF